MVFNQDELYMIMSFVGYDPLLQFLNRDAPNVLKIVKNEILRQMNIKYPMWNKTSRLADSPRCWEIDSIANIGMCLRKKYSIPIYYLNVAALAGDWSSFWIIIEYHGIEIIPAALLMCHYFKRFDISEELVRRYGFERLIPLVKGDRGISKYTWLGGVYQYPILYQMYESEYPDKQQFAKEWIESNRNNWSFTQIGFIHPKMRMDAKIPIPEKFQCKQQSFTEVMCDSPDELNDLLKSHKTRPFIEFPCVTQKAIEGAKGVISRDNFNLFFENANPIWVSHIMGFFEQNIHSQLKESKGWPSALRLAYRQYKKQQIDDSILDSYNY